MAHYEVEIKSLLGSKENADALRKKMHAHDPATKLVSTNSQLNHYFEGGDVTVLAHAVEGLFDAEARQKLLHMMVKGKNFSVRTREKDGVVLLVLKASIDAGSSENTVSRLEFEEKVALTLGELDQKVIDAGFTYQAKWSRVREEYVCSGFNVCLDLNAGYGYLAEVEKVVETEEAAAAARGEIVDFMSALSMHELSQDRLERMFAYYNKHWPQYYGTDKVFIIE